MHKSQACQTVSLVKRSSASFPRASSLNGGWPGTQVRVILVQWGKETSWKCLQSIRVDNLVHVKAVTLEGTAAWKLLFENASASPIYRTNLRVHNSFQIAIGGPHSILTSASKSQKRGQNLQRPHFDIQILVGHTPLWSLARASICFRVRAPPGRSPIVRSCADIQHRFSPPTPESCPAYPDVIFLFLILRRIIRRFLPTSGLPLLDVGTMSICM